MKSRTGLLVIDMQRDFCPGGSLPVAGGDQIVDILNAAMRVFWQHRLPVVLSRDWHPRMTKHFKKYGGQWPAHCVSHTAGARFHPDIKIPQGAIVVSKGMDPRQDDYSAFSARDSRGRTLGEIFRGRGVSTLVVGGLATDYCVRQSVLEALACGFKVYLLVDAIRGVDVHPWDSRNAIVQMRRRGARLLSWSQRKRLTCFRD